MTSVLNVFNSIRHLAVNQPTQQETAPNNGQTQNADVNGGPGTPPRTPGLNRHGFFQRFVPNRGGLPNVPTNSGHKDFRKALAAANIDAAAFHELSMVLNRDKDELESSKWNRPEGAETPISHVAHALKNAYYANYPLTGSAEMRKVAGAYIQAFVELCDSTAKVPDSLNNEMKFWLRAGLVAENAGMSPDEVANARKRFLNERQLFEDCFKDPLDLPEGPFQQAACDAALGFLSRFPDVTLHELRNGLGDGTLKIDAMDPDSKTELINAMKSGDSLEMLRNSEEARMTANHNSPNAKLSEADAEQVKRWMGDYARKALSGMPLSSMQ